MICPQCQCENLSKRSSATPVGRVLRRPVLTVANRIGMAPSFAESADNSSLRPRQSQPVRFPAFRPRTPTFLDARRKDIGLRVPRRRTERSHRALCGHQGFHKIVRGSSTRKTRRKLIDPVLACDDGRGASLCGNCKSGIRGRYHGAFWRAVRPRRSRAARLLCRAAMQEEMRRYRESWASRKNWDYRSASE